jgi:hypothetical protein
MNIEINFKGRLGNQMFEYAFGYNLSKIYNCNLFIKKNHQCILDKFFNIDLKKINTDSKKIYIKEKECYKDGYENNYLNLEDNDYLFDGYWQNENYFKEYADDIKKLYIVPKFNIPQDDLVIHVRRGDYVTKYKNTHFYCDENWYQKTISMFNFSQLHIITDDIEWCTKFFQKYNPIIPNLDEINSIGYISSFSQIIISNSTFGWWGAYLSDTDNVVCPKVWLPFKPCWETAKKEWIKI